MSLTVKQVKAFKVGNSEFRALGKPGMRSHGTPYHTLNKIRNPH